MTIGEQFDGVLAAAQAGANWALAAIWRDLHPALVRYMRAKEPRDAEDLAADVWLEVAADLRRFAGVESAFRAWVFTIARRRVIDARRRARSRRTDPVPQVPQRTAPDDPEAEALARLSTEEALARIAALPRDQAEVILLRVLAGLDTEQVAAILGKRRGHVRVLQHRALRRLAGQIRDVTERGPGAI